MDGFKVVVTPRNGKHVTLRDMLEEVSLTDEEKSRGDCEVEYNETDKSVYRFRYVSIREDLAMSVYARAKRNADLKRCSVALELPDRQKPRHLGSC